MYVKSVDWLFCCCCNHSQLCKAIALALHDDSEDGFVYSNLTQCSETDCLTERSNNFICMYKNKVKNHFNSRLFIYSSLILSVFPCVHKVYTVPYKYFYRQC